MDRVGCGSAAVGFTLRREMYMGILTRAWLGGPLSLPSGNGRAPIDTGSDGCIPQQPWGLALVVTVSTDDEQADAAPCSALHAQISWVADG